MQVILYQNAPTINNIKRVTNTVVYQATSIPDAGFRQSFLGDKDIPCLPQDAFPRPSKAEQMYALSLKQLTPSVVIAANTSNTTAISAGPAAGTAGGPPSRNTKFRLIQSVNYNDYCDIAVEVIKKFPNSNGNMELYVTDYTQNNNLYHYPDPDEADADDDFSRYEPTNAHHNPDSNRNLNREGDPYGYLANVTGKRKDWPGPSGRHTLQVELLPPHAGFARDRVQEGDFVKLSNVRIKQGSAGKMEGNIWTDRHYPEKIQVNKLIEEKHLKDLTARRDKYWEAHKNPAEQEVTKKPGKKAKNKKQKGKKALQAAIGIVGVDSASSDVVHNEHGMFMLLARYCIC
jgi:protection-of-telomeres protein 1